MRLLNTYQPRALTLNPVESLLDQGFPFLRDFHNWVEPRQQLAKLSVQESEQAYELRLETPGYTKDEIQVSVKEGVLSVQARQYNDAEKKELKSSLQRSVLLGKAVSAEEIVAKYSDGVLRLHVPKQEAAQSSIIPIEG